MASEETGTDGQQLVVFSLGGESYGVDVGSVSEIFPLQEITRVPNAPDYVKGVINLRGKVVPVIDLGTRLGIDTIEMTDESRIVVVEYDGEDVGMIVDDVYEVVNVEEADIAPVPSITDDFDSHALAQGFVKLEGALIVLMDIETVLGEQQQESPPDALEAAA